jgi:cysteine-rich repeat protein
MFQAARPQAGLLVALALAGCSGATATRSWISPPSSLVVHVEPAAPRTDDDLSVVVDVPSVPGSGEPVAYAFRWTRDGAVQDDLTGPVVAAARTARGQAWRVEVTPLAGEVAGVAVSGAVVVGNTPPSVDRIAFVSSQPKAGEAIEAVAAGMVDADADPVTLSFRWFIDDAEVPGVAGPVLPAERHGLHRRVRVEAAPFDGTETGAPVRSGEVVVGPAFIGCGNGVIEEGEACDDGNAVAWDACLPDCRVASCGDGVLGLAEQCDDGNRVDGDTCPSTCRWQRLVVGGETTFNGDNFLCRLSAGGLLCWGRNDHGQLGTGDTLNRYSAAELSTLGALDFGGGRRVVDVGLGLAFGCVRLEDGVVKCWGANGSGQLGLGDNRDRGGAAADMGDALPAVDLGTGRTAKQLAVGEASACVIRDDDTLVCWGSSGLSGTMLGQAAPLSEARGTGAGEMGDNLPAIDVGPGRKPVRVVLSRQWERVLVLRDDGSILAFGGNLNGDLGLETMSVVFDTPGLAPVRLPSGTGAVDVAGDALTTCATLTDGTTRCWGLDPGTHLSSAAVPRGGRPGTMGDALRPMAFGTGRSSRSLAVGANHGCAILDDDSVKCWGENYFFECSPSAAIESEGWQTGLYGDALRPLALGTTARPVDVAVSRGFSCALFDDGEVRCWGDPGPGLFGRGASGGLRTGYVRPEETLLAVPLPALP